MQDINIWMFPIQIAYWETYDGSLIRDLEGSKSGSIEGMDISIDGEYFVTGGTDKLIKVPVIYLFNCTYFALDLLQVVHSLFLPAHRKRTWRARSARIYERRSREWATCFPCRDSISVLRQKC